MSPEEKARQQIDAMLSASGWIIHRRCQLADFRLRDLSVLRPSRDIADELRTLRIAFEMSEHRKARSTRTRR